MLMALTGQAVTHMPQPVQRSGWICGRRWWMLLMA
jgi:hypothetical protein